MAVIRATFFKRATFDYVKASVLPSKYSESLPSQTKSRKRPALCEEQASPIPGSGTLNVYLPEAAPHILADDVPLIFELVVNSGRSTKRRTT
ncbi:hypothetical protein K443DRAFT_13101 [Laccaria amethystina LaAM-08-1]|uniref:Uncharacterized protein n=1 Tax=Laccaria amethystina LaAM-08-1 TaxID=1095629 RepID=A0A0C9X658_9AGAR|nr:hypothetical protein K443DRAFT_13101 [Laccaria amethystina LaAM-08-1]